MDTDTLIVGGGLAGLSLAAELNRAEHDFQLVEARDRFGGRILTESFDGGHFDLGPAWFWPGQPRIAALIDRLGLTPFDQFSDGELLFEDERGVVQRGRGYASMQGSLRLRGGFGNLIHALQTTLPAQRLHTSTPIIKISKTETGIAAQSAGGMAINAKRAVLALPSRLAATFCFAPDLPAPAFAAMTETATWMAGQAKAIAIYENAFWRDAGLSGDVMSRHGPMVEMHDASPARGGPSALFGFIGMPAHTRSDEKLLREHVLIQLTRLFGDAAASPIELLIKDWAYDPHTSTHLDQQPLFAHPQYGVPSDLAGLWGGALVFGGTESASQFGGYLEGALEAAENVFEALKIP